ncbi:MAG: primosomal protein N' [Gammaproteobacteria bacterium]|nr:primosomal protein N' [Gammaproteobacteria bacterium]
MADSQFVSVAIDKPLRQVFDYTVPTHLCGLLPGCRVLVPFGKNKLVAVVLETKNQTDISAEKIKSVLEVIDTTAIIRPGMLQWLMWVAEYYHHAVGEVIFAALPNLLKQAIPAEYATTVLWRINSTAQIDSLSSRAKKQIAVFRFIQQHPYGVNVEQLNQQFSNWRDSIKRLLDNNLVIRHEEQVLQTYEVTSPVSQISLNAEQTHCVDAIVKGLDRFTVFLLEGVTGSGKTEVYLDVMRQVIHKSQQVLMLVPEIGLTPQLIQRLQAGLQKQVFALHSGLSDRQRLHTWLAAREGQAQVVLGTRSAVFSEFQNLGLIIIDEEHDLSFKQQEGFRYHARDMAIHRAQQTQIPIILGSATPSLETLKSAYSQRYQIVQLKQRAGGASPPKLAIVDLNKQKTMAGLATNVIPMVREVLARDEQVLIFLNRRGFAPTLICPECAWIAHCRRCDAHMTVHRQQHRLCCHHCAAETKLPAECPECGSAQVNSLGFGTERIEEELKHIFPEVEIVRVDRDTTRQKGAMQSLTEKLKSGQKQILLGTQMLAKGHDFPNVTLVVILDADQGLYGSDFRSSERLAQLIIQVAGRAGRAEKPGRVVVQTRFPEHQLLNCVVKQGYDEFAKQALFEREETGLPPYRYAILIRAEATHSDLAMQFLRDCQTLLSDYADAIELLGPIPAAMVRKAGKHRAQLLLLGQKRGFLHQAAHWLLQQAKQSPQSNKVRWSIDVDPMELD